MPDFKCYKLKKTKAEGIPSKVLYLDTETKTSTQDLVTKHRLRLGYTCLCEYTKEGECKSDKWRLWRETYPLWNYVNSSIKAKQTLYIIAHNVFFDLQASDFFHYFTKWGWKLDFFYDKGLTYILNIRKDGKHIKCISSTNYYDFSLKVLGDKLGLPKLDADFEGMSLEELGTYCRRDVEIVKAATENYFEFILLHKLGKFSLTKSSQAFLAYRKRFMHTDIFPHQEKHIIKLERDSYFGGRCEAWRLGEVKGDKFCSYDIKSQYPFIMSTIEVPTKLIDYRKRPSKKVVRELLKNYAVCARVKLRTEEPIYALKKDKKIIFPVGTFETVLNTEGLKIAFERNHISRVIEMSVYEKAILFDEYIQYFYELKEKYGLDNDKIMRELSKKFLNTLYGKWGQKKVLTAQETDIDADGYERMEYVDLENGQVATCYKLFNTMCVEYMEVEGDKSFVTIAAHITEAARIYLYKLMETLGLDKIMYCDTDSLKFEAKHEHLLKDYISETDLGKLACEGYFKRFFIYGAKSYVSDDVRHIKGVPKSAIEVENGVFEYDTFRGQKTHMRERQMRWFIMEKTRKHIKVDYDKGTILPDGRVEPLRLQEF